MRSITRFIQWVLLGVGAWSALACSDRDAGALAVTASEKAALGQPLAAEAEPNATSATANAVANDVVIRGNVVPSGDADFFRFQAAANARVYAATMTAFSSASDVGFGDSILDLLGTNGSTVIETNDDQGSFGQFASSIAGATTTAAGNHFLRVRAFMTEQLRPYDLHLRVLSGAPAAEAEPNDDADVATPLGNTRWASGEITPGDFDVYSLTLAAGDTVFVSLDLDPERDEGGWDAVLEFGSFDGTNLFADDAEGYSSEALFATVKSAGTYYVMVSGFDVDLAGTYHLSVGVHPGATQGRNCVTYPSADAPKALTDAGRTTSVVNVPGSPRIGDLDVSVQIAHTRVQDLDVHLRSPEGSDIALFTDVGVAALDDIDLVIDDEAALPLSGAADELSPWTDFTALSGLIVQPETSNTPTTSTGSRLHWFDGQNAGGNWTLVVDDDTALQTGSLTSWALTVCEPPATRACQTGGGLVQAVNATFNSGADGFTTAGTGSQWARGLPTLPLSFAGCNGGSAGCWKTNLIGPYAANTDQDLVSPTINLANAVAPITLSWSMKYQLQSASSDHAWVEVRDAAGARTDRVWEFLDATMRETVGAETLEETAGWGVYTVDLSAFAGRTIQVAFHLDSNGSVQLGGFAVDDFSVSHCGCGDGLVAVGEQCDLGAQNGQAGRCCSAGCTFVTNGTGCNDGSVCTSGEVCSNGSCGNGAPLTCDDANVCTDNACSPSTGCVYTPNTAPCPNGTCSGGMCQMGGAGGMAGGGGAGGGPSGGAGTGGNPAGGGGVGGGGAGGAPSGGAGGTLAGTGGVAGNAGAGASGGGAGGAAGALGGQAGGGGQPGGGSGGGAQGGNAGMPPGGNAGEGGAPEGGAGQGGTGEGGEAGEATGGSATGGSPTGGSNTAGRGGNLPDSGVSGTSGDQGGEGGEGVSDRNAKDIESDGSCGCRVPGDSSRSEVPLLLGLVVAAAAFRRRRNRVTS